MSRGGLGSVGRMILARYMEIRSIWGAYSRMYWVAPPSRGLGGGAVPSFQGPLFWGNSDSSLHTRIDNTSSPPFIVLLESRIPGKNLGRFNLIALKDFIDSLISDTKRQIFPNCRNQAKVFCEQ